MHPPKRDGKQTLIQKNAKTVYIIISYIVLLLSKHCYHLRYLDDSMQEDKKKLNLKWYMQNHGDFFKEKIKSSVAIFKSTFTNKDKTANVSISDLEKWYIKIEQYDFYSRKLSKAS